MKLIHNDIIGYEIDFEENDFFALVIEEPEEFFKMTTQLHSQIENGVESEWVLSKDNKELSLPKTILFLYNFFDLDFSSKKIDTLINQSVLSVLKSGDFLQRLYNINNEISLLNQEVLSQIDLPIENEKEIILDDLVKILDYKISEEMSFLEKLITFIDIFVKLKNIKIVCFVNLFCFLSCEEIKTLQKQLRYMSLKALFLEATDRVAIEGMEKIIIDKDLCVI